MPLLDLFLLIVWFSLLITWLWLLITVFADIFGSRDLSGGAKAFWVAFVVFLPFLGVLVYLIARGAQLHERLRSRRAHAAQPGQGYVPRSAVSGNSGMDPLNDVKLQRDYGLANF
jgi:hypothetical protein